MKFRDGPVAITALIIISAWLFVGLPIYYGKTADDQTTERCSEKENKNYGFWEKTRCDPVAYFTAWLVAFTGVLAGVSIFQGIMLLRADKTARIAAEAAKSSADGIRNAERPHMVLNELAIKDINSPPKNGVVCCKIRARFGNCGKIPALLSCFYAAQIIGKKLPDSPDYETSILARYVIPPNNWYGTLDWTDFEIPHDIALKILSGERTFWYIAKLEYSDPFGHKHINRCAYRVFFGQGGQSEHYSPDGPNSYWEYT